MKTLESKPCPECTAEETLERFPNMSGCWTADSSENVKRCNNCGHEEPYHPRSPRNGKQHGTTDSQNRKLEKVRRFAEEHAADSWELETKHLDYGPMSITLILDPDSTVRRARLDAFLSRRGKVELKSCSGYFGDRDALASMFCRRTNGHDERP